MSPSCPSIHRRSASSRLSTRWCITNGPRNGGLEVPMTAEPLRALVIPSTFESDPPKQERTLPVHNLLPPPPKVTKACTKAKNDHFKRQQQSIIKMREGQGERGVGGGGGRGGGRGGQNSSSETSQNQQLYDRIVQQNQNTRLIEIREKEIEKSIPWLCTMCTSRSSLTAVRVIGALAGDECSNLSASMLVPY